MSGTEPALTTQSHDCGNTLYRVGSDRKLFCPTCKVQPASENDGEGDA